MTARCWDELYRAGKALAEGGAPHGIVAAVARDFELPQSPEAEAVHVFLDELAAALEDDGITGEGEA
jgi:hypothetical protein